MHLYFTLDETVNFVSYSFYVTFILFSVDVLTNKVHTMTNISGPERIHHDLCLVNPHRVAITESNWRYSHGFAIRSGGIRVPTRSHSKAPKPVYVKSWDPESIP